MNYRPFNDEELKTLLGKTVKTKKHGDLSIITDVINNYDKDLNFSYVTVFAHGDNYTGLDLLEDCTFIDDKPCGVEIPADEVFENLDKAIEALEKVNQGLKGYDNLLILDCINLLTKEKERLASEQ